MAFSSDLRKLLSMLSIELTSIRFWARAVSYPLLLASVQGGHSFFLSLNNIYFGSFTYVFMVHWRNFSPLIKKASREINPPKKPHATTNCRFRSEIFLARILLLNISNYVMQDSSFCHLSLINRKLGKVFETKHELRICLQMWGCFQS